jgi:hypothetical protein
MSDDQTFDAFAAIRFAEKGGEAFCMDRGPLLAVDGSVIGVVVARIDALRVAEATGDLPENINYAVTGRELPAFLEAEGVSLPRQAVEPVDFDSGIPESLQRAVVPILFVTR